MADKLLVQVQDTLDGQIDFEGQRLAEQLTTVLLSAAGVVAFIVGCILQDVHIMLYIGLAGTALTFFLVVPPWPFFNRNPVKWLPAANSDTARLDISVHGKKTT